MARWFSLGGVLCALCFLAGCGSSAPQPVAVSGTVNLDGKPLPDGKITLIGEEGGTPETLDIKEGKFETKALPGKKRVEIRAFRPGEKVKMGDMWLEAGQVNYLPARFNTKSKLTAEVTASGINPNTFDVTRE